MGMAGDGRSASRRTAVTLSVMGLIAVVVVALVVAYLATVLVLGPGAAGLGAGSGNGAPCAVNTPHATVARGDGIVVMVFLWFVRGTAGPTETPYNASATPIETGTRETVCILRVSDGALVTHYDIGATGIELIPDPGFLLAISPDGSEIYLSASSPGTQSTRLCAVGALTGMILWCQRFSGYIEQAAVDDTALYLLANGTLEALDPASGQPHWQQTGFDYDQFQPFVLDGSRIFEPFSDGVAAADELCAWSASDGSRAWCQRMPYDRSIFQFSAGDGYTTAIARLPSSLLVQEWRASDGQPLWQRRVTNLANPQQTLNVGGGVYLESGNAATSSLDYLLLALDAATGAQVWTLDTGVTPLTLYSGGSSSSLVALRDGTMLGYHPSATVASSTPAWETPLTQGGGEQVFSASAPIIYTIGAGEVGAVRPGDGKLLWRATNCRDGSESAPARDASGATRWCHWPDANTGFQMAAVSGSAALV